MQCLNFAKLKKWDTKNSCRLLVTSVNIVVIFFYIILDLIGLRVDGRRPQEFRKLEGKLSVIPQVDGSAFLQQGNTQVLVNISGPREVSFE